MENIERLATAIKGHGRASEHDKLGVPGLGEKAGDAPASAAIASGRSLSVAAHRLMQDTQLSPEVRAGVAEKQMQAQGESLAARQAAVLDARDEAAGVLA
jgi:hypothetical protein